MTHQVSKAEAKKFLRTLPYENRFIFESTTGIVESIFDAWSLAEFCDTLEIVSPDCVELHVAIGDLEKWIKEVIGDQFLAKKIEKITKSGLKGKELKNQIVRTVRNRYKGLAKILK